MDPHDISLITNKTAPVKQLTIYNMVAIFMI